MRSFHTHTINKEYKMLGPRFKLVSHWFTVTPNWRRHFLCKLDSWLQLASLFLPSLHFVLERMLPMGEDRRGQVYADPIKSLILRFIDGGWEGQPHRKLDTPQFEEQSIVFVGEERYFWYDNVLIMLWSVQQPSLKLVSSQFRHHHSRTVAVFFLCLMFQSSMTIALI